MSNASPVCMANFSLSMLLDSFVKQKMGTRSLRLAWQATVGTVVLLASLILPPVARAQGSCSTAGTSTSCSSTDVIKTATASNPGELSSPETANIYPSTINVPSSQVGTATVAKVQVELDNMTSLGNGEQLSFYYTEIVLESPGGQLEILGGPGDQSDGGGATSLTMLIGDGFGAMPDGTALPQTGQQDYKPSSYTGPGFGLGDFPSPGPGQESTSNEPQTWGSATMASIFNGGKAAGNWKLFLIDNWGDPITINGWKLYLSLDVTTLGTTTTVSSNLQPAYTANPNNSIIYTATVSAASGTPTGTVAFYDNSSGTAISCIGGNQTLSGGQATCVTALSAGTEAQCDTSTPPTWPIVCQGISQIKATYSGTTGFGVSSGTVDQLVEVHPTQSSTLWCNPAPAGFPGISTPSLYPSVIKVFGYANGTTVSDVKVILNGVNGTPDIQDQFLLVAPGSGGQNLDFLDDGFGGYAATGQTLTFFDTAGQFVPINSGPQTENYEATDDKAIVSSFGSSEAPTLDTGIPQVPGTIHFAQYYDSGNDKTDFGATAYTFAQAFNGAPANGDWSLYVNGYSGNEVSLSGGWCVDLTLNTGTPSVTSVSSSSLQATTGNSVTFTATVTDTHGSVSSGQVTFLDAGATPAGTSGGNNVVALNGSGQAAFTTSSLVEGDHTITATYSGSSNDNPSSGTVDQREDNATTFSNVSNTTATLCNAGAVLSTTGQIGAFTPNPSNIFASNIPGTLSKVTLALNNFFTGSNSINETESLVEGPTTAALDFFSNTGASNQSVSSGTLLFEDAASSIVPQSGFGPGGTYKPTSYNNVNNNADSFFSSSSGFYNAPSSFGYAASRGSSTFFNTFDGTNPNGTWSLFFNVLEATNSSGASNGWCLNLTETQPTVSVATSHTGDFTQGQANAQFTVNVDNNGTTGPTGDPSTGHTNPLKVTDALSSAFTYVSGSSTGGWSCSASGQTVTCSNDSAIAQGSNYPTLTINVNVGATTGSIGNSVSASGAGVSSTNSNADSITVDPVPVTIAEAPGATSIAAGGSTSLTFTLNNPATFAQTAIAFSDTFPSGMTVANPSGLGGTYVGTASAAPGGTTVSLSGALLPAGASCTVVVNVTSSTPGLATNTTSAVSSSPGGTGLTASASITVDQITPGVSLNAVSSPANRGTATSLTAVFTTIAGGPAPTQQMNFYAGATLVGTAALSSTSTTSYSATLSTNALPSGSQSIVATYPGDAAYVTASSSGQTIFVIANNLWIGDANNNTSAFSATGVAYLATPISAGGTGVAIDSSGNVWSLNAGSDSVAEFTNTGTVTNAGYTGGGLSTPTSLAIDGSGQVWITNANNSISVFGSDGSPVSTTAYTGGALSSPTSVAIDISGNLWIANSGSNSVTEVLGAAAPTVTLASGVANNAPATEP